jgi:hypothetical protein
MADNNQFEISTAHDTLRNVCKHVSVLERTRHQMIGIIFE